MGTKAIAQANGKTGRVFLDGNELCVTQWDITVVAEKFDVTNSCSAGYAEYAYGTEEATGTIQADLDTTVTPFDSVPNIRTGVELALKLYLLATPGVGLEDGPYWSFNASIDQVNMVNPSRGKITYNFTYQSQGAITWPTGDISASA